MYKFIIFMQILSVIEIPLHATRSTVEGANYKEDGDFMAEVTLVLGIEA